MKVVNYRELLAMPAGTIYRERGYGDRFFGLFRKDENVTDEDTGEARLVEHEILNVEEWDGKVYEVWNTTGEYAVYEPHDLDRLAGLIGRPPMPPVTDEAIDRLIVDLDEAASGLSCDDPPEYGLPIYSGGPAGGLRRVVREWLAGLIGRGPGWVAQQGETSTDV